MKYTNVTQQYIFVVLGIEFYNFMHYFDTLYRNVLFNQTTGNIIFLGFQYCRIECMH